VREVVDILLSGWKGRGNGRAACAKRSEREQGREMAKNKIQVLIKISKNQALKQWGLGSEILVILIIGFIFSSTVLLI